MSDMPPEARRSNVTLRTPPEVMRYAADKIDAEADRDGGPDRVTLAGIALGLRTYADHYYESAVGTGDDRVG